MKQIRMVRVAGAAEFRGRSFACEWMEASLNNRWLLKTRLAEALQADGVDTHRIELRDKIAEPVYVTA